MKYALVCLASLFVLTACEGDFAGDRPFQLEEVNAPYRMRSFVINGTAYLGVINTNTPPKFSDGSLHFYDISNPRSPVLDEGLSLPVPSNVSDFYYVAETEELYLLDRNEDRLRGYRLSGGEFSPIRASDGNDLAVKLLANPASMTFFLRGEDQTPYLAISCFGTGSIQFFDLENRHLLQESDIRDILETIEGKKEIYFRGRQDLVGASLEMSARTKKITGHAIKPSIDGISGGASIGRGINELIYLGGEQEVFVAASFVDTALFGFHLKTFDNTSNLLWDLPAYEDGRESGGQEFFGTGEPGIRGIALDGSENLYASFRSDNSIYKIPASVFRASREVVGKKPDRSVDLNTTAFQVDRRPYRLAINFDEDPTDDRFPRLAAIAINNRDSGTATRAYVLGMDDPDRGFEKSRVYLVDLEGETVLDTFSLEESSAAQALLLHDSEDILYVSSKEANSISVLDVSGDNFVLVKTLGPTEEE